MGTDLEGDGYIYLHSDWREVPDQLLDEWNRRLEATPCSFHQFPFWLEPHRLLGFAPKYFVCGPTDNPIAFCAILETRKFGVRVGLIDRGPFLFTHSDDVQERCISSLVELAKSLGYAFIRFTQGQESVFMRLQRLKSAYCTEPYPFSRDSRNSLTVEQKESDDDVLASFDRIARKKIRKASDCNYTIRVSSSNEDFERAWELFERLARRKGFTLSSKPKAVWSEMLRLGGHRGLCRLYLCYHNEQLLSAQYLARDGVMAEGILCALDLDLLGEKPTPGSLLQWFVMRDCHKLGCKYYDMGGPGDPKRNNHVFGFKREFRPSLIVAPEPLCLVLRPFRYWLWTKVFLRGWRAYRRRFGNLGRKVGDPAGVANSVANRFRGASRHPSQDEDEEAHLASKT